MKQGELKNRRVDKASVRKTKQALWQHMAANKPKPKRFLWNPFESIFKPSRLAVVGSFLFLIVAVSIYTIPSYRSNALTEVDFRMMPAVEVFQQGEGFILINLTSSARIDTEVLASNISMDPPYEFRVDKLDDKTHGILIEKNPELGDNITIDIKNPKTDENVASFEYRIVDTQTAKDLIGEKFTPQFGVDLHPIVEQVSPGGLVEPVAPPPADIAPTSS